jgi:hypothetical protein
MYWNKRDQKCSMSTKLISQMLCTNCTHLLTSLLVSIIHPPDRCGISINWLNSMIITQVYLVLGKIKGHSKMCNCVTQHNATDVWSWGGAQLAWWLQECPPELLTDNLIREFGSTSNRPHNHRPVSVWRHVGELFADVNITPLPSWSTMIWAGISYGQWTQLHFIDGSLNAQRYRDEILRPIVVPFITSCFSLIMHVSMSQGSVHNSWKLKNVPVLPWPAYSPDMSPIEHVRDALDWRVLQRVPVPAYIQQLRTTIEVEWDYVPQVTIKKTLCEGDAWRSIRQMAELFSDLSPYLNIFFKGICYQQMHIYIPSQGKSID